MEEDTFDFMLWQLLHRTFRTVNKVREKELETWGLTSRKSAVLRAILRLGPKATTTEISRQLVLEINTISEQLTRMQQEGLVRKVQDPAKKSIFRIELTEKGFELCNKTDVQNSIERMMAVLSDAEKKKLWSVLSKLRKEAAKELGVKNEESYPPSGLGKA